MRSVFIDDLLCLSSQCDFLGLQKLYLVVLCFDLLGIFFLSGVGGRSESFEPSLGSCDPWY